MNVTGPNNVLIHIIIGFRKAKVSVYMRGTESINLQFLPPEMANGWIMLSEKPDL